MLQFRKNTLMCKTLAFTAALAMTFSTMSLISFAVDSDVQVTESASNGNFKEEYESQEPRFRQMDYEAEKSL